MNTLPTISIIVPNYNGGKTLAGTLQCLIDQNYPALEILVADGGSTDDSVAIIQSFASHLTWWVSEKDRGQSHAINKAFAAAHGEIVNWLCSDDRLEPGCLQFVGETFRSDPALDVLAGAAIHVETVGARSTSYSYPSMAAIEMIPVANPIPQPACFYRRRIISAPTLLNEDLHYVMDFDLWCRFRQDRARWKTADRILARTLSDGQNKTATGGKKIADEMVRVYQTYVTDERMPLAARYRRWLYPLDRFRARHPRMAVPVRAAKLALQLAFSPIYGWQRTRTMNWSAYV